ncbi:hypothetical protein ACFQ1I_27440 [Kitasatospora arboriphila]
MIGPWAGALLGLAAAPLLRAVAVRHAVPYGEPLRQCCPAGRWGRWPTGRCAGCGEAAAGPRPGAVEAVAVAVGAALGTAADAAAPRCSAGWACSGWCSASSTRRCCGCRTH